MMNARVALRSAQSVGRQMIGRSTARGFTASSTIENTSNQPQGYGCPGCRCGEGCQCRVKKWNVYLSGEIHSDWREVIAQGVQDKGLPVTLTAPNTSHEDSDDCGAIILGMQEERPNWDKIGASMNAIRTKTLLQQADIVVVRFGEKYRQWNAAMDAGYAAALGKPLITLHPPSISHMLKEVNASANVVCQEPSQVVDTLAYVIRGELPATPWDGDKFVPIADRLGKGNPNP